MIVAAAVLVTSATQALAQGISDERLGDSEERIEEFQTRLRLTDEQLEELRPVIAENSEKIRLALEEAGLQQGGGGGASSLGRRGRIRLGRQIRDIQEETDKKMREILMDEQLDEYEAIQAERREELRARIQGGGR